MVDLEKARQKIRTRPVGSTTLGGRSKICPCRKGRGKFFPLPINCLMRAELESRSDILGFTKQKDNTASPARRKIPLGIFPERNSPTSAAFSSRYKKGFLTQGFIPNGEVVIWKGLTLPGDNRLFPHPSVYHLPPVPARGFCRQARQYPG